MNNLCPIWAQYKSFRINLARVRDLWRVCTMEHYRRIDERVPAASRRSTREPGCCKRGHRVGGSSGSTLRFAREVEPFAMRVAWTAPGHHGASGSHPIRSTGAPARAHRRRCAFTDADARAPRRGAVSAKRSVPALCPRPSARVVGGGAAARDSTRTDDAGGAASSAPTGGRELPEARDRPAAPRAHHAPAAADRAKPRLLQENGTSRSAWHSRR